MLSLLLLLFVSKFSEVAQYPFTSYKCSRERTNPILCFKAAEYCMYFCYNVKKRLKVEHYIELHTPQLLRVHVLLKILRLNQFFSKRATRAKERRAKERSALFKSGLCSFLKRKLEIHSFHPAFPLFYAQNKGANRSRRSLKRVKKRFALFCQKMSASHEKPEREFPTLHPAEYPGPLLYPIKLFAAIKNLVRQRL